MKTFTFTVPDAHAPALRSAIDELSDTIAVRASEFYSYPIEDAMTGCLNAIGSLRAAVHSQVPAGDPYYKGRRA